MELRGAVVLFPDFYCRYEPIKHRRGSETKVGGAQVLKMSQQVQCDRVMLFLPRKYHFIVRLLCFICELPQLNSEEGTGLISVPKTATETKSSMISASFNFINSIIGSGIIGRHSANPEMKLHAVHCGLKS